MRLGWMAATAIAALSSFSAPALAQETIERAAVIVNDDVITLTDVRQRARLILLGLGVEPSQEAQQQAVEQAIEQLIDERVMLQETAEREVPVSDEDVDREIARLAAQNQTSASAFLSQLRGAGVNPATLRQQLEAEIAWRRLMGGLYGSRITISQLQIDDVIERVTASVDKPQYQLAEIFLFAPDAESAGQAMQAANRLREEIERGAPFPLVARQFSSAPSAATGGDLGWLTAGEIRDEFLAAVEAVAPPGVTQPVESADGVHLFFVRGKREPAQSQTRVLLKQLIPSGETGAAELQAARDNLTDCASVETVASETEGVTAINLGRIPQESLSGALFDTVATTPAGAASGVVETPRGPAVFYVCDREVVGAQTPSRDEVEDRLFQQQIAMLADRYLRDLRRESMIIRR